MTTATFNAGLAYHDFLQVKAAYRLAAFVAFLMSSYFVVGYLAGNLEMWTWDFSQWINGLVGFGITGSMTAFQYFLYSGGRLFKGALSTAVAICVAASFSLLSEVGQGVERDNIRMETKSQQSPTYQAIVGQLGQSTAGSNRPNPYAWSLQQAETRLARCQENVKAGVWKDCNESQARVTAVKQMIRQYYQHEQNKSLALAELAKNLERDENNYHPLVNFIRQSFGVTGITGSFLLSLLIISFFEYAFHYLGGLYASRKNQLLNHGFDVTTRERKTPLPAPVAERSRSELNQISSQDAPVRDAPVAAPDAPVAKPPQTAPHKADAPVATSQDAPVATPSFAKIMERWHKADSVKVGDLFACAICEKQTKKRTDTKRFCSENCRKEYHRLKKEQPGTDQKVAA